MATSTNESHGKAGDNTRVVTSDVVAADRVPPGQLEKLVHRDATPLHSLPKDNKTEAGLARIENLIGKGHFGAALRSARKLEIRDNILAENYRLMLQDKLSRTHIGIARRYAIRGDKLNAQRFYEQVLRPETIDERSREIIDLAGRAFDELTKRRKDLIQGIKNSVKEGQHEQLCEKKKDLGRLTVLDLDAVRKRVMPDFRLEMALGERPPIDPEPGYIDPVAPESEFVGFSSAVPGAIFRANTEEGVPVDLDLPEIGGGDGPTRASVAMPVFGSVFEAKLGVFALDTGLTPTGQAAGTVPLYRYEYLRDKVKEVIGRIDRIESKMLPIQFLLDDFAEVADAIRRPLSEQRAELEAANQRIAELTDTLGALTEIEGTLNTIVIAFHDAESECECDWFCWVITISVGVFIAAVALALAIAISAAPGLGPALAGTGIAIVGGLLASLAAVQTKQTLTCENVGEIGDAYEPALKGVQQALTEVEAELTFVMGLRDVLIANINALADELAEWKASNESRVLDADTLNLIQTQYNALRHSLLTRAQVVAKHAQEAFNFERDSEANVIKDAYYDDDRKGYTSAESLMRDLDGLDFIDLTGRTQKVMQISHTVSLQKHYPISFLALKATGGARFTTALEEFDRWFPGTYAQRIKEIRVEVLRGDEVVRVRGYISNDGVSIVRFRDTGNKRKVDNVNVFAESDEDLARLCYKRLQRRRHVDTMAFPDFESYLYEYRMRKVQDRERNFFENIGLESSWIIELLPDQPLEYSQISDVRIEFQYEALFDENLKRILEKKRYSDRKEMVALPVTRLLEPEGQTPDFSDSVTATVTRDLFEAPALTRTVANVGFFVKLKDQAQLDRPVELEVSFEGAEPIRVFTNGNGVVATAADHPAGDGLEDLETMTHGQKVDGTWSIRIMSLPDGLTTDEVDDVILLINYEFTDEQP
jgi:hypothetical protein